MTSRRPCEMMAAFRTRDLNLPGAAYQSRVCVFHFKDFLAKPSAFFTHPNKPHGKYTPKVTVLSAASATMYSVRTLISTLVYLPSHVSGAGSIVAFSCVSKLCMFLYLFESISRKWCQKDFPEFVQVGSQITANTSFH